MAVTGTPAPPAGTAGPAPLDPARRPWRGLTGRQARLTLVIVIAAALVGSLVQSLFDWRTAHRQAREDMALAFAMIRGPATEAAYQLSQELADRVAAGLMSWDVVEALRFTDNFGQVLTRRERSDRPEAPGLLDRLLFGDLTQQAIDVHETPGDPGSKLLGRIEVRLSAGLLTRDFLTRAAVNSAIGAAWALSVCAIVVAAFYWMITRPLVRLSELVAGVAPARPGAHLLPPLKGHDRDELGLVVSSLNDLLTAFQQGLDARDRAEAENLRLGAELDVARKIQRMILPGPAELTLVPGLEVAPYMEPAQEIGGDYYDILPDRGGLRIGIGDVTGHGLESGVVMLMTQTAVRTLVTARSDDWPQTFDVLNRTLHDNVRRMGTDKQLTLALIDYRPAGAEGPARLRISGQHEMVIVARADGRIERLDTLDLGMPLGMVEEVIPFVGEASLSLAPGDTVLLYTDGITEAADGGHRLYGLDRLCDVLATHHRLEATAVRDAIIADVKRHVGAQALYDDLTLIVLKQR